MSKPNEAERVKHTPGPWRVETRPDGLGGKDVLVYGGSLPVCDCFMALASSTPAEERANARLIAAAPTMLQALKLAFNDLAENGRITQPVEIIIRQAIEKAEAK